MAMPDVKYPIRTYRGLKEAVSLWMDRDDDEFVNQIPNFINFGEKEIYRNLRIPAFEKEAYLRIRKGVAFVPVDLLEIKYITLFSNGQMFRSTSPEEIDWQRRDKTNNSLSFDSKELLFTRMGQRLYFSPQLEARIPDPSLDDIPEDAVIICYYRDTVEMVNDDDTNAILTVAPELLLYYALRHAALFVQDDMAAQKWSAVGKAALDEIVEQNMKLEYSGSPLAITNAYAGVNSFSHYGQIRTSL